MKRIHLRKRHVLIGAAVIGVGIAVGTRSHKAIVSPVPTISISGPCRSVNGLPDSYCTPGVTNPNVTQSNISQTICVSGFTALIRPSVSYTSTLKTQQIKLYGYLDTNPANYEEDHEIPLELGGSPTDSKNLWPEPRRNISPPALGAEDKDLVENRLHKEVCAGQMSLQEAQREISTNWETAR